MDMDFTRSVSQLKSMDKSLDQEESQTQGMIKSSKEEAEEEVKEAVRKVKARSDELVELNKESAENAEERVKEAGSDSQSAIVEDVNGVSAALQADSKAVNNQRNSLTAALAEADTLVENAAKQGNSDVQSLQEEAADNAKADAAAAKEADKALQTGGERLVSSSNTQLQNAEKAGEAQVNSAAKEAEREAEKARARAHQSAAELQQAMDMLQEVSDEEVKAVGTSVDSVKSWISKAAAEDAKRTENLKDSFADIEAEGL